MQHTTSHLMRAYARQPVSFTRGSGARLWDESGVEYLDAIAGVAVTSLGHAHPEIAAVIAEQAGLLLHTSNVFRIDWQEQLGERLCALAGMATSLTPSGASASSTAFITAGRDSAVPADTYSPDPVFGIPAIARNSSIVMLRCSDGSDLRPKGQIFHISEPR